MYAAIVYANWFKKAWLVSIFVNIVVADETNPQTVQWSSKSYGPDGPWQAISVSIGTPAQRIDLLPGGVWASPVLAPSVCSNGAACQIVNLAGFYDSTKSSTTFQIGQTGQVVNSSLGGADAALGSVTGSANWMFDTMSIEMRDGVVGNTYYAVVQDFDLLVMSEALEKLPDGTTYPIQIGHLSLGAPEFNESWLHFPPNPKWNGTLLPSTLFGQGNAPSNSYGLHIGSADLGIPGSLNIGGFDPSRALEPISSQVYAIDRLPIDLLDIGVGVAEGASPFNFTSQTGLLAQGNSSLGISTTVLVEPQVPYLYLPQSTCDAITQYLPVTFQPKYGLYFWNTNDPNYQRIVTSPSFLSFTFRLNSSISQNMTINLPFALLNLTLTAPLTSTPTSYLPLRPGPGPSGSYELGRAFLQTAFMGVNWQTASGDGAGVWFLAQAPGPNTPSSNPLTVIGAKDSGIVGSDVSWAETWKGSWSVLGAAGSASTAVSNSSSSSNGSSSHGREKVGVGVIVGIVVGALVVVVALSLTLLYYKRQKAKKEILETAGTVSYGPIGEITAGPYKDSGYGPRELEAKYELAKPVEMAG
ncbi:uncharacterized protein LY89DRAFT_691514 [Mollisia scopiformis]|uniref:Peptidase A1 domain-containing protein n=1 Tax=Mollisia scopiformis TaxID=149040 RepID=A0A132B5Y6_MOLSC|nr:uncharacterized protein LY89DRAFT_691514 [Mollisia scopiformis]KUJ07825.1 hypothetical protein LY89DRAFT_691514 [Mollisia scopiformis]